MPEQAKQDYKVPAEEYERLCRIEANVRLLFDKNWEHLKDETLARLSELVEGHTLNED